MKKIAVLAGLILYSVAFGQKINEYEFKHIVNNDHTSVLSQGQTGTCWSYSTVSFLESEVKRITGKNVDLSEMFIVRNTYPEKAYNYVYRDGKAQFSEGGLAHDVINAVRKYGMVPQEAYTGLMGTAEKHDHSIMVDKLTGYVENLVNYKKAFLTENWQKEFNAILDENMGKAPTTFQFEGKTYTPRQFTEFLKINPDDYVSISSFTHVPYYKSFVLSIPDNFSNGSFYNLPLDEYMEVMNEALNKGFTLSFSSDVSESTFSAKQGMAILPLEGKKEDYFKILLPEKWATAEERQKNFENFSTQDDHLMHITGILKDQLGNQYYDVKNSWGSDLANGGDVYMSAAFIRMKSIAFLVHKDALSKDLKKKLGIQ
jgi:bleomycin hydrolase